MIAVDTNILVYAHRQDSTWHAAARDRLTELAEGKAAWAMPWPCIHEFLAIATHPRIYDPPSSIEQATDQVEAWFESPSLTLLAETPAFWNRLRDLVMKSRVIGAQVHHARVAALCLHHAVRQLWTADRDFSRFPDLDIRNPLVGD